MRKLKYAMLVSLLALGITGLIMPLCSVSAMGSATIKGTIGLADHGNAPLQGAKVVIKIGSSIIGQDYTDSNGKYNILTDPIRSKSSVVMKVTYTKTGFYGKSYWCKSKTKSFSIYPGGVYTKNVNLYDNSESKTVSFVLQYTTKRQFYLTASWTCTYNPYNNKATIKFESWSAIIFTSELASEIYFAFGAYKNYPYTSSNRIYSYAEFFEYNNGWNQLSDNPGVSTSTGCIQLIDVIHGTWSIVIWDSYHGDYWEAFGQYYPIVSLTY